MSVEVTMRRGGGVVEVLEDLAGIQRVEFLELAHRAFNGESSQSRIVFDDDNGEVASDLNLPVGLTKIQMSAHNVIVVTETATTPPTVIGRGRYASKTVKRADHAIGRARQVEITMDDANMHLRGMAFLEPEERPAETDVERMTWLLGAYLQGSPRFTTDLTSRIIGDDPVTMPARTYDAGSHPIDVLNDCIRAAEKIGFVTIDDELYYAPVGDTSYMAGMRISDREEEHNFEGSCPPVFAPLGLLGSACLASGTNFASDHPAWAGDNEERVAITAASAVAVGDSMVAVVSWNQDGPNAARAETIYDERGNTWVKDAESTASGTPDYMGEIWHCNVTTAIQAGDYIRFAINLESSILSSSESGASCIGVYAFAGSLSSPSVGGGATGFSAVPALGSTATGDLTVVVASIPDNTPGGAAGDADWTAMVPYIQIDGSSSNQSGVIGQFLSPGGGDAWTGSVDQTRDWSAKSVAYTTGAGGEEEDLPTFPPIDPTVIEEGQELLSGGVLRYGGGQHVSEVRPSIADEYDRWVETVNDDGAVDATDAASRLSKAIDEQQYEGRTYDVGVLLRNDQVCLVKPGQMIWIKARAIPDADDQFALRRIAELRRAWAGPGHYMHIFKLDRPLRAGRLTPGGGDNGAKALATKPSTAAQMPYDGTGSGLTADDVQDAIDELAAASEAMGDPTDLIFTLGSAVTIIDDATYNAFPGICRLANGTLIVVYRQGTDHSGTDDGRILKRTSTDDGATWSAAATVYDPATDARDPQITLLSDGTLIVSFFLYTDPNATDVGIIRSTDSGATWGTAVTVTAAAAGFSGGQVASTAPIVELDDGQLVFPIYGLPSGGGAEWDARALFSDDRGDTWGSAVTIEDDAGNDWTEPYVHRFADGELLCLIRVDDINDIYSSRSTDNGLTWSDAAFAFDGTGRPAMVQTRSGALVCIYRKATALDVVYRVSWDHGATWAAETTIDASSDSQYASAVPISDQAIGIVYGLGGFTTNSDVLFRTLTDDSTITELGHTRVYGDWSFGNTEPSPTGVVGGATTAEVVEALGEYLAGHGVLDYVGKVGADAASTALDDLSDVAITSPAANQAIRYDGSTWVNTSAVWRPVMDGAGAVVTDGGTGEAIMALS